MRTLEKADTPILGGMRIYHNFVKPHMALKGKTPAEVAGIKVEANKRMTIIQNTRKANLLVLPAATYLKCGAQQRL
jgi:hypothetical protein